MGKFISGLLDIAAAGLIGVVIYHGFFKSDKDKVPCSVYEPIPIEVKIGEDYFVKSARAFINSRRAFFGSKTYRFRRSVVENRQINFEDGNGHKWKVNVPEDISPGKRLLSLEFDESNHRCYAESRRYF